ncbi:MAG: hypothetical protein GC191_10815 [Azospirillum sp.]|nr:hypothetical protein [Azospirillum sp.]
MTEPASPVKDSVLESPVADYKRILQAVLELRPSGLRQRLAEAIGKNRSFISQITNPAYPTPIPVQYLDHIFEICHFSSQHRAAFLAAYRRAHPRRLSLLKHHERTRRVTLAVPDLGDDARNQRLDEFLTEYAERLAHLLLEG